MSGLDHLVDASVVGAAEPVKTLNREIEVGNPKALIYGVMRTVFKTATFYRSLQ